MGEWEGIWKSDSGKRLWRIPDRGVAELCARWKADGSIRRVLDLGCGVGRHLQLFAAEGFEAHGLDHSPSGVEACQERLASAGFSTHLYVSEMDEAPCPAGYFDAVVAFNSVYHGRRARVQATIDEIHRVLRPGGKCFVTMVSRQSRMYGKGEPIEANTYASPGMFGELLGGKGEIGVPHYFSSDGDIAEFFRNYRIESIEHAELELATGASWLRIPKSYFWRVVAERP